MIVVWFLEPNLSSAEPDRAAGAASGGKPPNYQPHKGLCDGAHRHRSCVSQRPPAIQKCQWFLGPTLRRPSHFPRRQTPGLPICFRQPWSSRCSGKMPEFLPIQNNPITANFLNIITFFCWAVSCEHILSLYFILDAGCVLHPQV